MPRGRSTGVVRPEKRPAAPPAPAGLPTRVPVGDPSVTRRRLIEAAEALFYAEGFHAVGLDRVLLAVGISKQGFYRHFESKDDLALEVVRWHDRWWRDHSRRLLAERAGGDDARGQLAAFAEILIEQIADDDFRGCFFVNAVAQFPNPRDPVHRAAVEAKSHIDAMTRDLALRAAADDPVAFNREFSLIFEGAFATRCLQPADEVVPVLRRMVGHLFAERLPPIP